ncbi:hypothetical protein ABNC50_20155 [Paenibacillus larvae]
MDLRVGCEISGFKVMTHNPFSAARQQALDDNVLLILKLQQALNLSVLLLLVISTANLLISS